MTNHQVSVDDQCCEEQMMFPYLLNLENEPELLGDEPTEGITHVPEPEKNPTEPMVAGALFSHTTTSPTMDTSNTMNVSAGGAHSINETLDTLRSKLAEAQKEIADLCRIAFQSDLRARKQELRMLSMENNMRELMLLHSTIQDSNRPNGNLTTPMTQPSVSTKRTLGENFDYNPPQPPAKRTKTIKVNTTKPKREKVYAGKKPHCSKCNLHHQGPCSTPCDKCHLFGHRTKDCKLPTLGADSNTSKICFECGGTGHIRSGCPQLKMKSNNPNNPTGTSYNTNPNLIRYR